MENKLAEQLYRASERQKLIDSGQYKPLFRRKRDTEFKRDLQAVNYDCGYDNGYDDYGVLLNRKKRAATYKGYTVQVNF
jgi:Zn-finger domain-containing protein